MAITLGIIPEFGCPLLSYPYYITSSRPVGCILTGLSYKKTPTLVRSGFSLSTKIGNRVGFSAATHYLEVEVGTGTISGVAGIGDNLPLRHHLAGTYH